MTKTIEEAAREAVRKEYLCESCAYKDDCDLCGGENTAFDCCECPADSYEDGFKAGAKHVYDLPLSSRLTAEEKEKVRKVYRRNCAEIAKHDNDVITAHSEGVMHALELFFGADMFNGI